jgi:hypothetical protein
MHLFEKRQAAFSFQLNYFCPKNFNAELSEMSRRDQNGRHSHLAKANGASTVR